MKNLARNLRGRVAWRGVSLWLRRRRARASLGAARAEDDAHARASPSPWRFRGEPEAGRRRNVDFAPTGSIDASPAPSSPATEASVPAMHGPARARNACGFPSRRKGRRTRRSPSPPRRRPPAVDDAASAGPGDLAARPGRARRDPVADLLPRRRRRAAGAGPASPIPSARATGAPRANAMKSFYSARAFAPVWVDAAGLNAPGRSALARLKRAATTASISPPSRFRRRR